MRSWLGLDGFRCASPRAGLARPAASPRGRRVTAAALRTRPRSARSACRAISSWWRPRRRPRGRCRAPWSRAMTLARRRGSIRRRTVLLGRGKSCAVDDRLHAGKRRRLRSIDRLDDRVRVRAAQDPPQSMPGRRISAPYTARPVTLSMPSGRTGARADDLDLSTVRHVRISLSLGPASRRRIEDGADDLVVAGAAAEVARQPVADRARSGRVLIEQRLGCHDEARRADAALQRRVFEEASAAAGAAHALGDPLDRGRSRPFGLDAEHQAGVHQLAVEDDVAGAAVAVVAAFLGAGQAQLIAQHIEGWCPVRRGIGRLRR
jgi:hypothetical protein